VDFYKRIKLYASGSRKKKRENGKTRIMKAIINSFLQCGSTWTFVFGAPLKQVEIKLW
jgi:hypothetical protein